MREKNKNDYLKTRVISVHFLQCFRCGKTVSICDNPACYKPLNSRKKIFCTRQSHFCSEHCLNYKNNWKGFQK